MAQTVAASAAQPDPMTAVLATFRRQEATDWDQAKSAEYLARRPIFSQVGLTPPWDE